MVIVNKSQSFAQNGKYIENLTTLFEGMSI